MNPCTIDLNCDLGEGLDNDPALIPLITSANIACGAHAGDLPTMLRTVEWCLQHDVAIGAHPGYYDRENFGRVEQALSKQQVLQLVQKQLILLDDVCRRAGAQMVHVKPHGALYNAAARDAHLADAIAFAIAHFNPQLMLVGLANSEMIQSARRHGLVAANEVFADRTYQGDGTLTPRSRSDALIDDPRASLRQVLTMIRDKHVIATDGRRVEVKADTLCVHGDGAHAVAIVKALRAGLQQAGVEIRKIR